jgi:hypothetical protein
MRFVLWGMPRVHVSLVLQQRATRDLPLGLNRGLAGVISNTIVRDARLQLGPPIPGTCSGCGTVGARPFPDVRGVLTKACDARHAPACDLLESIPK